MLNHTAVIDPLLVAQDATANEIAYFSSRGPTIGEFGIKPELVAVGTDVFTATQSYDPNSDMWNPDGYGAYSGTSFSTPMVAGAAALVHQKTAGLTPADIKSALVNTASAGIQDPALAKSGRHPHDGGRKVGRERRDQFQRQRRSGHRILRQRQHLAAHRAHAETPQSGIDAGYGHLECAFPVDPEPDHLDPRAGCGGEPGQCLAVR